MKINNRCAKNTSTIIELYLIDSEFNFAEFLEFFEIHSGESKQEVCHFSNLMILKKNNLKILEHVFVEREILDENYVTICCKLIFPGPSAAICKCHKSRNASRNCRHITITLHSK